MAILILVGLAVQGIFGVAAGILVSSIIGIIYGTVKKNRQFVKWSVSSRHRPDLHRAVLCRIGRRNVIFILDFQWFDITI